MKHCEALIAWTPVGFDKKTDGMVAVGHLVGKYEPDWTAPYAYTGGAAYIDVRNMSGNESLAKIFIDFHSMIVRDGIDPQVAHKAFLNIDEYAKHISPDIEGSV